MTASKLYVISGPSGVGKGTLVSLIVPRLPHCELAISATTRSPRPGETDGVSYYFLSEEQFDDLVSHEGFLEWATFNGHRYGTPRQKVLDRLAVGNDVLLEIDVQGAMQVKEAYPEAQLLFIAPPSFDELERRLRERGTESEEAIESRLQTASLELSQQMNYDAVFVNDDLSQTADALVSFMSGSEPTSRS